MARLSTHLRLALHDWMWEGGFHPTPARRLARRLPLYFSDPEAHDISTDRLPLRGVRADASPFVIEINPQAKTWVSGTTLPFINPPSMTRPDLRA